MYTFRFYFQKRLWPHFAIDNYEAFGAAILAICRDFCLN